jgi:hypothetical protein
MMQSQNIQTVAGSPLVPVGAAEMQIAFAEHGFAKWWPIDDPEMADVVPRYSMLLLPFH